MFFFVGKKKLLQNKDCLKKIYNKEKIQDKRERIRDRKYGIQKHYKCFFFVFHNILCFIYKTNYVTKKQETMRLKKKLQKKKLV